MRAPTHPPRKRFAVVAVLVSALLLTLSAQPALAGPPTDNGVGGNSGSSGSGSATKPTTSYKCGDGGATTSLASYRLRKSSGTWDKFYEAAYTDCLGTGAMKTNVSTTICQSGYLVYRFYGTYADFQNGSAAMTRSRANSTAWCEGVTDRAWTFPTTSPLDSDPSAAATLPWLNPSYSGTNNDQALNGSDSLWSIDDAGHWLPSRPTKVTAASCEQKQTSTTMRTYYEEVAALPGTTSGDANTAAVENLNNVKSFLGNMFWQASNGGDGRLAAWARSEIGVTALSGYRYNASDWTDHTQAPARNDAGESYFAADVTFDTRPCASPTMFSATSQTAATDRTYTGTCYIPLMRTKVDIVTTKGVRTEKWLPLVYGLNDSAFNNQQGYGERLYTGFGTSQYTQANDGSNPDFTLDVNMGTQKVSSLTSSEQSSMLSRWRSMMSGDYLSWASDMYGGSGSKQNQAVPANAYGAVGTAITLNKNDAANQLAAYSRCRLGTQALFNAPEFTESPVKNAQVDVTVADQKVFQVSPTAATIKVTSGALKCQQDDGTFGACPTDGSVTLSSLTWTTNLDSTDGKLRLCKVSDVSSMIPSSCDGVWSMTSSGSSVKKADTIKVRFVNPTKASDALRLAVSGVSATFSQVKTSEGLTVTGYNPVTGAKYTVSTGVLKTIETRPASVDVTGAPVPLTNTAGTYTATFPVIGVTVRS